MTTDVDLVQKRRPQEAAASLSIRGLDLSAVAERLQVRADKFHRRGELAPWGRTRWKWDRWVIEERIAEVPSDMEYTAAVHGCLDRLLARIQEHGLVAKLRGLELEERPVISVHGHCYEIPCLYYPAETIRLIADLGADLWEDFYPIPDEGSEAKGPA